MNRLVTIMLILALLFAGCKSMNKTQKGAAVGVGAGAAMGAIIGKAAGNTAIGAIIGATVGGAAGAVIGKKMDKQAEEIKKEVPNAEVIHNPGEEGIIVNFKSNVLFATDKYALTPTSTGTVNDLITILNKYPDTDLKVEGHTDSQGSEAYNQTLSERRARSVADYLITNNIAASRITTHGFGETQPVASNETVEGRTQNRRVTFVITANEKMKADAQKEAGASK